MENEQREHRRWLLVGCLSGLAANILYIAVAIGLDGTAPPLRLLYTAAWFFGPLVIVAGAALAADLVRNGLPVLPELGRLFMTVAGGIVTISTAIRGIAEHRVWPARPEDAAYAARWADEPVQNALLLTQRGVELAWDVFIYLALLAFAVAMIRIDRASRILGLLGALIAVLGLAFDAAVWPADSDSAELIDFGPFAGLWFMAVAIRMGWRWSRMRLQKS
jgi:hypothetical protein